jgi:hypothetical protein
MKPAVSLVCMVAFRGGRIEIRGEIIIMLELREELLFRLAGLRWGVLALENWRQIGLLHIGLPSRRPTGVAE